LAEKFDGDILLKRAIALIENGQIGETIEDLNNLISKSNNNSEALLFKGLAYSRIHNYNEAILSY
jgi:Flp pilus assembly protein TadD